MNWHKVYTVVWFDRLNQRHEATFDEPVPLESKEFASRLHEETGKEVWIEEDWLEPNVSY